MSKKLDTKEPAAVPGVNLVDYGARMATLAEEMEAIHAKVRGEERDFSDDEAKRLDELRAEFDRIEADKERVDAIAARAERVAQVYRQTDPEQPAKQTVRVPAAARDASESGRHGFRAFGEFARSVIRASSKENPVVDPRLNFRAATYVNEGVGTEGGFLVPPDFRARLTELVMGEDSLLARTDQQTASGNTWTAPADEATPWGTSGIQAYWDGEGDQLTASKPAFNQLSLRLNRLTALVKVSDEMLEDAPGLESYLMSKAPAVINFKVNHALINGTGAGQPLGILKAPCLVTVAKETSQANYTVRAKNIMDMWARLYAPYRAGAVWLINQDLEAALPFMGALVTTPDGTTAAGGAGLVYMPPGGLSGAQYGTILGRPVIPTEACSSIGVLGDVILAALPQYLTVTKAGASIRTDISMHLYFDYALMAFRFIFRLAGQPWLSAPIARASGSNTLSSFVTLAARS